MGGAAAATVVSPVMLSAPASALGSPVKAAGQLAGSYPGRLTTARFGMTSPRDEWELRLGQVQATGGKLRGRRLFVSSFSSVPSYLKIAKSEWAAGRFPVLSLSYKGDTEWAKFANGGYDSALRTMFTQVKANGHPMAWTIAHEPIGDGSSPRYVAMFKHVAPMFKAAGITFGPIYNGYMWSAASQGMTDAQIAAWCPDSLIPLTAFIGADCYQGGTFASPGENAAVKINRLNTWAGRHGVTELGLGEYNGMDANALKAADDAIRSTSRMGWANVFNSSRNNRPGVDWTLSGARLSEFQRVLKLQG